MYFLTNTEISVMKFNGAFIYAKQGFEGICF